jgi:hypothetical protein
MANLNNITEKWFFDNGYWTLSIETRSAFRYSIVNSEEKWKKLMDTIFRKYGTKRMITPKMLVDTIEEGNVKRTRKNKTYIKIKKPEGYLTVRERKEKARKDREIRNLRHDNRNAK